MNVEELVTGFYPQALVNRANQRYADGGPAPFREQSFTLAEQRVEVQADNDLEVVMYSPADSEIMMRVYPICDIDRDRDVDQNDIQAINAALGNPASSPSDRRDSDGDGAISATDVWVCQDACTLPSCQVPQVQVSRGSISATPGERDMPAKTK